MAARSSVATLRKRFAARGVFVFVMTPFKHTTNRKGKFEPDLEGIEGNARYFSHIKGDKTLVICGGSGEFGSLSSAEVIALGQAAATGAEGRCNVVVGIGVHGPGSSSSRL